MQTTRGILIDNTTLHSLTAKRADRAVLPMRAREICRIVETFLLGDSVWVSDSVSSETFDITRNLHHQFIDAGLAQPSGTGKFRISMFSPHKLREACTLAAPDIINSISHIKLDGCTPFPYTVRPINAPPILFSKVLDLEYGSDRADEFIEDALAHPGWGASAAAVLLNADLYCWMKGREEILKNPADPAHLMLNTFFRWHINEQLAAQMSKDTKNPVYYSPAIGRAKQIDENIRNSWNFKISELEQKIYHIIDDSKNNELEDMKKSLRQLDPIIENPIPMFGI